MEKFNELQRIAKAEGLDLNDLVASRIKSFHESLRDIMSNAKALPTEAGVAFEGALRDLERGAGAVMGHTSLIDGSGRHGYGKGKGK